MVDTAAQDVERSVDGVARLLTQDLLDLAVGAVGVDILPIGAHEDRGQRSAVRIGLERLDESSDEIALAALFRLFGSCDGSLESGIVLALAGQRLHNVADLNLQHDVHTALQVQTEVELLLLALLVGVGLESQVVDRLILQRIEIVAHHRVAHLNLIPCGILLGGLLHASCLERERKLEDAGQRQKHRNQFNCSFTLHFALKICCYFLLFSCQ